MVLEKCCVWVILVEVDQGPGNLNDSGLRKVSARFGGGSCATRVSHRATANVLSHLSAPVQRRVGSECFSSTAWYALRSSNRKYEKGAADVHMYHQKYSNVGSLFQVPD